MPTIRITLEPDTLADLDAIRARSGYTRSEQVAGMIEAAKEEEQEILRRDSDTDDEIWCRACGRARCLGCVNEDGCAEE